MDPKTIAPPPSQAALETPRYFQFPLILVINPSQRGRLELLLKKLRVFGEENVFQNGAYIEALIQTGEDRRMQYLPTLDCIESVENILEDYATQPFMLAPVDPPSAWPLDGYLDKSSLPVGEASVFLPVPERVEVRRAR